MQRANSTPYLTSSKTWWRSLQIGGIFDADPRRSPWAGANLVYIGYCTSDGWSGDAGPETNAFGWAFRGQRMIEATFAALTKGVNVTTTTTVHYANHTHADVTSSAVYALGASDHVLFSGCSAGARGAMFNVDYVQPMLPPGAPPVLGFFDSPLWVDIQPAQADIMPLENETAAVLVLANATGRLGDACAAAYPGDEAWRCLYGQFRLPFVQTPYLLSASQFDKYQLSYNEGGLPPYYGANLSYADRFQSAVRSVVLDLPVRGSQPRSAVYSSACFKHCTSSLAWGAFWGVRVANVSLMKYLGDWYFGAAPPSSTSAGAAVLLPGVSAQHIEACTGFGCGQCHNRRYAIAPPLPPAYSASEPGFPPAGIAAMAGRSAAHNREVGQRSSHPLPAWLPLALVALVGAGLCSVSGPLRGRLVAALRNAGPQALEESWPPPLMGLGVPPSRRPKTPEAAGGAGISIEMTGRRSSTPDAGASRATTPVPHVRQRTPDSGETKPLLSRPPSRR